MLPEVKKAREIIDRIRRHKGWSAGHCLMKFGEITVGYYDVVERGGGFFHLKYDNICMMCKDGGDYELGFRCGRSFTGLDMMAWLTQLDKIVTEPIVEPNDMNASEAVYGLMAWLTTRPIALCLSASNDAGKPADLVMLFCKVNNLEPVRDDKYPQNLTIPTIEQEQRN